MRGGRRTRMFYGIYRTVYTKVPGSPIGPCDTREDADRRMTTALAGLDGLLVRVGIAKLKEAPRG